MVLLVDEAQTLRDTRHVHDHLDTLHGGVSGDTSVQLVCFGLANTVDRLRDLGLSRLATDHVRTIGSLSNEDAATVVTCTLDNALADFPFDHGPFDSIQRKQWISTAAQTILPISRTTWRTAVEDWQKSCWTMVWATNLLSNCCATSAGGTGRTTTMPGFALGLGTWWRWPMHSRTERTDGRRQPISK